MNVLDGILNLTSTVSNVVNQSRQVDLSNKALDVKKHAFDNELRYNYDRLRFEQQRHQDNVNLAVNSPVLQTRALMNAGYRIDPYSDGRQKYLGDQLAAMNHAYYSFYRKMD